MKRITKRILVLMLCTVLLFASTHSIYSSTFTLEVQAAEVVIAAEAGAAIIEYLFGLLLTAGLIDAVTSWSDRVLEINTCLDKLAAYPEITADMTLTINVNGKELEVTYDQYTTYIKNNLVDGTGAVNVGHEVFTVLSGGGGKNGGDKDHEVQLLAQGAFSWMFYKMVSGGYGLLNGSSSQPTDDELAMINDAYEQLVPAGAFVPESDSLTIRHRTIYAGDNYNVTYHFHITDDYDGGVPDAYTTSSGTVAEYGLNNVFLSSYDREESIAFRRTYSFRQKIYPSDTAYSILFLAPATIQNGSGDVVDLSLFPVVVTFSGTGTVETAFNNFRFNAWKAYPQTYTAQHALVSDVVVSLHVFNQYSHFDEWMRNEDYGLSSFQVHRYLLPMDDFNMFFTKQSGVDYLSFSRGFTDTGETVKNYDADFYIQSYRGINNGSMPVILLDDMAKLPAVCDGLLDNWDMNVFANYSGNADTGIFRPSAYNQVSESALSNLADAVLHGNAGTDAVIDAAQAVDALREVEPVRLPEFYPDLYPEYLPEADPAEYPEVYPDYDPVTNPNPAPVLPPNPDRVVDTVVQPITNPNPNPNPDPDDSGDDWDFGDWDIGDVSLSLSDYFPFCIPFDLIHAFKLLTADAEAPYWEVPIHAEIFGVVIDYTFVIDMSLFEPLAKIFRTCETIGFCVGLILITRNMIRG